MPDDGPSSRSIPHAAARSPATYALVNLDYAATQVIAAHPPQPLLSLAGGSSLAPTNQIAAGDTLAVSVFESSEGALFGVGNTNTNGGTSTSQSTLPGTVVDADGNLSVPYVGLVHVEGLTPREAASLIAHALSRREINPQVVVSVVSSNANSVTVIGQVKSSGRFLLTPYNDRLLDVLASAGGPTENPADLKVVISRGAQYSQVQLSDLMADPTNNIRLAPHDQVRVVNEPRKYSTFGALRGDSQTAIGDDTVTLAEAISRAGGLDTTTANPSWVLVFRFEQPEVASALNVTLSPASKGVPIVYRLDLRKPEKFFVAQNFYMRADDMIYVPRSDLTEAKKFFDFINEITQIYYNTRVTAALQ
jgi:polysaccharide export outer membrane protein